VAATRSRQEKVSDWLWGAPDPTPEHRKHLELIRQSARDAGRQVEDIAMRELEAKMAGPGVMAPPTRGYREAPRWGGQYRRASASDFDWFDGLSIDEKKRLSERWFAPQGRGEAPDEIAERIPIKDWLALTRQADLGRAMASGKGTNSARFGGLRPSSLVAGEPYQFEELHNSDAGRAARHVRQAREAGRFGVDEGNRCQFRTRPDGTIYPLASTCRGAYVTSAPAVDYGADEAF
jgi:hypothetical protein